MIQIVEGDSGPCRGSPGVHQDCNRLTRAVITRRTHGAGPGHLDAKRLHPGLLHAIVNWSMHDRRWEARGGGMDAADMQNLVDRHLRAEKAGDPDGCVAMYTDDVVHDAVGWPGAPYRGRKAARDFYQSLMENFRIEGEEFTHRYVSESAMTLESTVVGTVTGSMLGLPGNDREVTFRLLHVFEFRDGLISRENLWLDTGAIINQLS
jgi:steroid delta-isomerase-like uncharacterized protein